MTVIHAQLLMSGHFFEASANRYADDADAADQRGSDRGESAKIRCIRVIRVPIQPKSSSASAFQFVPFEKVSWLQAQLIGAQALLPLQELQKLIEAAHRSEQIDMQINEDDVPAWGWMRLLEQSGTFDFWEEPGEDIYSLEDGEPV